MCRGEMEMNTVHRNHGRLARLAALSLALLCGACAGRIDQISPQNVGPLVDQFVDGNAVLDCELSCAGKFGFNRQAMLAMSQSGDWANLARTVISIGYNQDLSWFYLGLSAQGLGLGDAAVTYYTKALDTPRYCNNGSSNVCDGFVFPDDIYAQLDVMGVKL